MVALYFPTPNLFHIESKKLVSRLKYIQTKYRRFVTWCKTLICDPVFVECLTSDFLFLEAFMETPVTAYN